MSEKLFIQIMNTAYAFRDAHLSGSTEAKRAAHAGLQGEIRAALAGTAPAQPSSPDAVVKMLEKKAADYADEFGHEDMGNLSFGSGSHAQVKMDHYTSLLELADEIRAMPAAMRAGEEPVAEVIECPTMGQQTLRELNGRWKFLRYGTKLYTHPQPAAQDAEREARMFHEAYERLAPSFGYETRSDTREFDPASPNGKLMVAVCGELQPAAPAQTRTHMRELAVYRLTVDNDEALIRQLVEALEAMQSYARAEGKGLLITDEAVVAGRARLGEEQP